MPSTSATTQLTKRLDQSAAGRVAHGAANAMGTFGEWFDKRAGTK